MFTIKTAVLIPCYNEAKTIEKVIKDFKMVLPDSDIYVYDNNSQMVPIKSQRMRVQSSGTSIIRTRNVVRAMFREIKADCYIMVDGDDTYPAEPAKEFERIVLNGEVNMVIGDRLSSTYFEENDRPFHNMGNRMVRKSINMFFKSDLNDIMTGMRAFSYNFVLSHSRFHQRSLR